MPDSDPRSAVPSFERLRKSAKQLLRDCRAGDAAALQRLQSRLPRLGSLNPADAARAVRLADVQHALALEAGVEHWAALRHTIESLEPLVAQVQRFVHAMVAGDATTMQRVLAAHPEAAKAAVHTAAAACDEATVNAWLARGAAHATQPLAPGRGWTPIECLAASPLGVLDADHLAVSERIARTLLAAGADANATTNPPDTEPGVRLTALYRASERGNAGVVRVLLEAGADPNDGESTYHAAERDHRAVLELLLAHGAELSAEHAHWHNTVLYYLCGHRPDGHMIASATRGMAWLLEHGADPNIPSYKSRETPLHRIAASNHTVELADLFLAHGANPAAVRADGRTPFELAVRAGNTAVAERLRAAGAAHELRADDELLGACATGDVATAQRLRDENAGLIETLGTHGRAALFDAASNGRVAAARAFVALGFDVAREADHGGTALHAAAWNGRLEMVKVLLELGAPVNVRDATYGSTPLAWAAHGSVNCRTADDEYISVIDVLLAAGSLREPSFNQWNEPPEALGSEAVADHLRAVGFAPAEE